MPTTRRRSRCRTTRSLLLHLAALVVTALYLIPLLNLLLVALTPTGEPATGTVPSRFAWGNFAEAMQASDFGLFFANSVLVTLTSTVSQVVLSCMAGYALAKMPVRGKSRILFGLVALLVVPPEVMMVPLFTLFSHVPLAGGNDWLGQGGAGLLDTYLVMILPHAASALGIFLMRQFYIDLPDELGQSARVDGASELRIFTQIYTPLALPAVAVVTVLAFQSAWNDFLWPLVTVKSNDMRTLQLGLAVFYQENSTQWNLLMAAVLMMTIPIIAIFLYGQRFFTDGVAAGAVKQ
ncbi:MULTISPECIES: carbohydrate ABC transporter permease [unclassified Actinomyces]|uniref:carbohydrate ABC transporter permease n=1 Tax=unclassified Actinomyces TaxID=2609248 RepID=UPI002016FC7C|nr:carbohydrate ABC transporter permease [Actinomyces sp. 187325]